MEQRYGTEVWNRGMERILHGGMERGYETGVWNGCGPGACSGPPILTCPHICIYINIIKYASDIHLFSCISLELSCLLVRISSVSKSFTQWIDIVRVDTKDHHSFCAEFLGSAKGRKPWFSPVRGFLPGAKKKNHDQKEWKEKISLGSGSGPNFGFEDITSIQLYFLYFYHLLLTSFSESLKDLHLTPRHQATLVSVTSPAVGVPW